MGKEKLTFYFDYVDPGSYLLDRLLDKFSVDRDHLALHPLEVCPPPKPPIDPTNPEWISYNTNIHQLARESGLDWHLPTSYPWTRKAHELSLHARDKGLEEFVHKEIFKAHFQQHLDIGRIDVLVAIASKSGLDPSETKATLDVDKYSEIIHLLSLELDDHQLTQSINEVLKETDYKENFINDMKDDKKIILQSDNDSKNNLIDM